MFTTSLLIFPDGIMRFLSMINSMRTVVTALLLLLGSTLYAQEQEDLFGIDTKARTKNRRSESGLGNITRGLISTISLELSGGYGLHSNTMEFQSSTPGSYPIVPLSSDGNSAIGSGENVTFDSKGSLVPFDAGVRIDLFGLFSIGGGYGREFGKIDPIQSDAYHFNFEGGKYVYDKLYGTLGLVLYDAQRRRAFLNMKYRKYDSNNLYMQAEKKIRMRQNYPWRFVLEGEYGSIMIRESFDVNVTATEPFYSLGLRIEREFSEYTKLFVKPNASFRKYAYQRAGLEETQTINQNIYAVNVGLSVRLPGTKRCKVTGCGVKMKHLHNGVEYRGSSIWNLQNRKVGQWY